MVGIGKGGDNETHKKAYSFNGNCQQKYCCWLPTIVKNDWCLKEVFELKIKCTFFNKWSCNHFLALEYFLLMDA